MPKKSNLEEMITRSQQIHNNEYDYSLIKEYKGTMKKYPIKCYTHGVWEVSLDNHILKKSGCPKCKGIGFSNEEKIKRAQQIHQNKYDYSLINELIIQSKKYKLKCILCDTIFSNTWDNHVNKKQGCPECNPSGRKKRTLDSIKSQISNLNTGYEYDWDTYNGYFSSNFKIKCQKHGWFNQQVSNHLMGQRCPKCKQSKGEKEIEKFLIENSIEYETQKRFNNCKNKKMLPFDFYIPSINLCIEYDGELHYNSVEFFGGNEHLKKTLKHDAIKSKFCKENNINLIRISYFNFQNINKILLNISHDRQ
jgi:Zn finger protein HypA/HybF involved in hydrogenase expression